MIGRVRVREWEVKVFGVCDFSEMDRHTMYGTAECLRSFHGGEVVPQVFEAVGAAEQCGEVGGVEEHDVACTRAGGWHPDQRVEFRVPGGGEGMGPSGVDALASQDS